MAASRNASNSSSASTPNSGIDTGRVSFAKIAEPLEVPDLLALQANSFDWLVGNDDWQGRVAQAKEEGRTDVSTKSGLEEIFEEISPIEDFSGTMSLSFRDHRFEPPKNTVEECKERDFTYAAPLFVTAEFMNNETGEIKSQTVFMGDFPLMTDKGTFIVNGTERVVVSQLVRSPGVYFERSIDKTSDKDIFTVEGHPFAWCVARVRDRQARHGRRPPRPQAQAERHRAAQGAAGQVRRRRRQGQVRPEWDYDATIAELSQYESFQLTLEKDHTAGPDDALLDIYRKLRPGEPPTREAALTLLDNYYFNPKRYDLAKVGRYKINKKLGQDEAFDQQTLTYDDIVAAIRYIIVAARRCGDDRGAAWRGRRRVRRHRPLRQPPAAYRRRAHPEPAPYGPGPDGARGPRADDDPGRRGDHAADPDQHPPRGRCAEGVLRHLAAQPVHGPDQPARGSDPQAPSVGARARRSVA